MSLYRSDIGLYTQSSETSVDDGTLSAVYDIADASTLMEAVVKIRGEHTIDYYSLTLLDNTGISSNCSAEATYSAFSDETVIVIRPGGSNYIGGPGNTWKIEGPMTIEGVAMAISIKAPEPSITVITSPQLPLSNTGTAQDIELTKSDNSNWTEQEFLDFVVMVDGDKCLVTAGSSEISYATRNIYATIARSYIGQTTAIMQTSNREFTLESIDLG